MNLASLRLFLLTLITVCLATSSAGAFELGFLKLCCYKTTEPGSDEVYLLVLGRRSDGQLFDCRLPADRPNDRAGHWAMHAGVQHEKPAEGHYDGKAKCITNGKLFEGDLAEGQSWSFLVFVMEEDGGTAKRLREVAAAALRETGDLWAANATGVLDTLAKLGFGVRDSDDYIGSFAVRITKAADGRLKTEWAERDHATTQNAGTTAAGNAQHELRFDGDDSDYTGIFYVR